MPHYQVSFYKEVTGDTGNEVDAVQAEIEVEARDEAEAMRLAKQKFCGERQIIDWQVNADRIEIITRHHRDED